MTGGGSGGGPRGVQMMREKGEEERAGTERAARFWGRMLPFCVAPKNVDDADFEDKQVCFDQPCQFLFPSSDRSP